MVKTNDMRQGTAVAFMKDGKRIVAVLLDSRRSNTRDCFVIAPKMLVTKIDLHMITEYKLPNEDWQTAESIEWSNSQIELRHTETREHPLYL